MRLASRFGRYNSIRRERPLTDDELMQFVPSVFSGDKHESRSERYTYIPTINIINKLRDEGFQPFFACQSAYFHERRSLNNFHRDRVITFEQIAE
ncbi:DUF932 domain-containing protein, partial [Escherichia coli]